MNLRPNRRGAGTRIAALAVIAAAAIGACSSSATSAPLPVGAAESGNVPAATSAPAAPMDASGAPAGSLAGVTDQAGRAASGTGSQPGTPNALPQTGPLIVRTGTVRLQVADLDAALTKAQGIVSTAGGYVSAGQRSGDGASATASITYRIPAAKFDETLAALHAVGQKLLSEQLSSDEVTSQVVDLGARIDNLRATEAALQKIMDQATKISDVLDVQTQLSQTRDEIERLVAQQQGLQDQAALATLTVTFGLPPVVATTTVSQGWDPASVVDRAVATMVGLGQGVAEAGIWFGIVVLPIAIVIGIPSLLALALIRRHRRNHPKAAGPATPPALWPTA